ncbi:protein anti-silencing 1 [Tanacetum coccineum]|uniref:Protein anti-silencing 1 n=1 Tax=Tanacetum coccineum TaxID=301880 RepID=A0ABQ5HI81_9ASTR
MENVNEDAHPEFKWLKKKGVGLKDKEVQFYESFLYDGVKYTLYDDVYMYKEGLQEPYIGKLTKVWERPGNIKKVKVHWFFRPIEILKWLGNTKTLVNEILFASGEGHGLTNINSLESIAGPCNVVCVSKDHRNPQPSAEELEAADFVFYRTFDVQSCTISDTMADKVGGLEVKYVFNRGEIRESIPDTKQKNTTCSESQQLLTTIVPNTLEDDPNILKRSITPTESDKLNDRPLKKLKPGGKNTPEEEHAEPEVDQDSEELTGMPLKKSKVDNTNKIQVEVNNLKGVGTSGTNSETGKTDIANKDDRNVSIVPVDKKVENKERSKTPTGSDRLPNQPFKKQNSDVKNPPMVDNKSKHEEKLPADVNNLKDLGTSGATEEKLNQKNGKISSKVTDDSEGKIIQNSKDGGSAKLPDNKKLGNNGSVSAKLPGNKKLGNSGSGKDLVANPSLAKGKSKSELALDSTANNKGSKQEQFSEDKIIKKSNNDGSEKLPDNKKLGNSGSGKDLVANSTLAKGKSKSGLPLDSTANNKESKEEQSSEGKIIKSSKDDGSAKRPDNKQPGNSGSGKDLVASSSLPKEKSKSGLALDSTTPNKPPTFISLLHQE